MKSSKKIVLFLVLLSRCCFGMSDANLVAWWQMNDKAADTNVVDSASAGDYTGAANKNTEDMNAVGKVGGALDFNGVNDYVDTGDTFESVFQDEFSINLWFKANDGRPDGEEIFVGVDKVAVGGNDNWFWLSNFYGYPRASYGVNYPDNDLLMAIILESPFKDDEETDWTMITGVITKISSSTAKCELYLNGELEATSSVGDTILSEYSNIYELYIGSENYKGDDASHFSGLIDNVTIWNKALSSNEIAFLYNDGNGREDLDPHLLRTRQFSGKDPLPTLNPKGTREFIQWQ